MESDEGFRAEGVAMSGKGSRYGNRTSRVAVSFPEDTLIALDEFLEANGKKRSEVVVEAVNHWLSSAAEAFKGAK